jgi:hypothetical protein
VNAPEQLFTDLASFCEAIERAGIQAVVVRRIHEIRPRTLPGHRVEVGPQRWVELAAYREGALYRAHLAEASSPEVEAQLRSRGLKLRTVTGNVT